MQVVVNVSGVVSILERFEFASVPDFSGETKIRPRIFISKE